LTAGRAGRSWDEAVPAFVGLRIDLARDVPRVRLPTKDSGMVVRQKRIWGGAFAGQRPLQMPSGWIDLLLLAGIFGLFYGLVHIAGQWSAVMRPKVEIDLSPWMLPWYTFQSLMRGMFAYALSLIFTLVYGYWAAKDHRAERVLVPMLDILQSIPVLGFMPGLVLALVALFPHSNTGLELAAVLMIFTGQVWNMTFSFYRSVQTVPRELQESTEVFGLSWWQKIRCVELPFATLGLVWNSMMSMAGGWFFLMLSESFQLGDQDFRLPGLGSYMKVAADQKDYLAQGYAIVAMVLMVVALDQFLWRPLVAWAQKFRVEEGGGGGEVATSWFLDWLLRSNLLPVVVSVLRWIRRPLVALIRLRPLRPVSRPGRARFTGWLDTLMAWNRGTPARQPSESAVIGVACDVTAVPVGPGGGAVAVTSWVSPAMLVALLGLMTWGACGLISLLLKVNLTTWETIGYSGGITFVRVIVATILGTLWTVPVGLAIGLSPRLSRILQPVIQIAASFPASMLFPIVINVLAACGVTLGYSSIVLMLLGTQWYILFNVIAGAMTIPADLREAAHAYGITGWQRLSTLYLPAIFPYLVTGWVTSVGGAWNASIVAEYMSTDSGTIATVGLGSMISKAATDSDLPTLAASVVAMSLLVVGINRTLWKRLYRMSETTFSLDK
jgi:NitT/TauT family transport system permease protein